MKKMFIIDNIPSMITPVCPRIVCSEATWTRDEHSNSEQQEQEATRANKEVEKMENSAPLIETLCLVVHMRRGAWISELRLFSKSGERFDETVFLAFVQTPPGVGSINYKTFPNDKVFLLLNTLAKTLRWWRESDFLTASKRTPRCWLLGSLVALIQFVKLNKCTEIND